MAYLAGHGDSYRQKFLESRYSVLTTATEGAFVRRFAGCYKVNPIRRALR